MPGPVRRCADWSHNSLGEHLRKRSTEAAKQSQTQAVNSNVVVFPVCTRREQRPRVPFAALAFNREIPVTIDNIRLTEQRPFPFRRVPQQMAPRNCAIMGAVESSIMHGSAHRFIKVADQSIHDRDPRQHAQIALRRRECEVHLSGISPTHDFRSRPDDKSIGLTSRPNRPQNFVERSWLEIAALQMTFQVIGPGSFVLTGEPGGFLQPHPVHPSLVRHEFGPFCSMRRRQDGGQSHAVLLVKIRDTMTDRRMGA